MNAYHIKMVNIHLKLIYNLKEQGIKRIVSFILWIRLEEEE